MIMAAMVALCTMQALPVMPAMQSWRTGFGSLDCSIWHLPWLPLALTMPTLTFADGSLTNMSKEGLIEPNETDIRNWLKGIRDIGYVWMLFGWLFGL